MSDKTSIEWTDATWNPVRGCSRVSPGCEHCYAERVAARFSGPGQPYEGLATMRPSGDPNCDFGPKGPSRVRPRWTGEVRMVPEHLADPLRRKRPRRIFVNSMSDLFHEKLTNEEIAAVFGVMAAAPRHTFQVLTKRAERMRDWFAWIEGGFAGPTTRCVGAYETIATGIPLRVMPSWPLANVWLGVSVEDQRRADERIPLLLETSAAVRFISAEPLLGPVNPRPFTLGAGAYCFDCGGAGVRIDEDGCCATCGKDAAWYGIDWVIAGAESGPGARPMKEDWVRSLRWQCAAAGVPFFYKQAMRDGKLVKLPFLDGRQHVEWPT